MPFLLYNQVTGNENVTAILIEYVYSSMGDGTPAPTTTFTVATAIHASHEWKTQAPTLGITFSNSDKLIIVPTSLLFPIQGGGAAYVNPSFLYTGTEYKHSDNYGGKFAGYSGFVTPWKGITVSDLSNETTFNVNWETANLIEQRCTNYTGSGEHSCKDCVYVFADKFWER